MGLLAKTDLTNQRQVFVEKYVRSGDHLDAAKKAGYKETRIRFEIRLVSSAESVADEITEGVTP